MDKLIYNELLYFNNTLKTAEKIVSIAKMEINNITIRVYGILTNEQKGVLVSDEYIRGKYFTKFPGGGLEPGEGTRDCLQREMKEETGLDMTICGHIYTTDFFQQSAFKSTDQIIAIYYSVQTDQIPLLKTADTPFAFKNINLSSTDQAESLRWIHWNEFGEASVSLPIDKIVARIIKQKSISPN